MSRLRTAAALAVALVALAACGNGIPPQQSYATIKGRAYDVATNAGVPGVQITVLTILVTTTAADGTYAIANVPPGDCSYDYAVIPPEGYAVQQLPACGSLVAGQTATIDIPLVHS